MIIESFDDVLRTPKRLHAIELTPGGQKLPLWKPVSHASAQLFVVIEVVLIFMAKVPLLDFLHELVASMFGSWAYYTVLPAGIVWLAFYAELDGRAPHLWAYSYMLFLIRPKRTIAGRPMKSSGTKIRSAGKIKIWWDLDAPRLHHGWVRGGRVTTNVPVNFAHSFRHTKPTIRANDDYARIVEYEVAQKLEVRA